MKKNIQELLNLAHEQENTFNKEMSKIDNQVKLLLIRKERLKKKISGNMKYRNWLIKQLKSD